jgi:periplasmic protein TonB
VLHFDDLGPDTPRLPERSLGALSQVLGSAIVHATVVLTIGFVFTPSTRGRETLSNRVTEVDLQHIVFVATDPPLMGSGGGGGGNQQAGPIRRAQSVGSDAITLRVRKPFPASPSVTDPATSAQDVPPLPSVVLDAEPLAVGTLEQLGLPSSGVLSGTSTGPGTGGGVGTGAGTGIGSGRGPGVGPGSGGGTGGGAFRPGGAVTAPRVIREVKPTYTEDAVARRIQGTVVLELVVTREGRPAHIRIVRSLDPEGLDEQAIAAVAEWRFEPGRLAGAPVDVVVVVMLDFYIR